MRKTARFLVVLLLVTSLLMPITAYAYEPDFSVSANAVYLVNLDEDKVLYEKNAHERVYPASLTKIMTAILTLENVDNLDTTISMKAYIQDVMYLANLESGGSLSLSGLLRGEELSIRNLLYAIMLPSGNEAAMMLGDYVGDGSVDYFVQMMNDKAKELGANNTHFVNTNGMHNPDQYTTAYDMYLLARYAMMLPGFMEIVSTTYFDGGPTNLHQQLNWNTTNKMMVKASESYYAPVKGMKTGSTPEAGRCFISTASKSGYNYLMVVMGAPMYTSSGEAYETNQAFVQTKAIYEWAFNSFSTKTLIEKGEGIGEIPLKLAKDGKDHLLLMSGERYSALLPAELEASSVTYELDLPEVVLAPVERGTQVGTIRLMLAGEQVGEVPAVAAEKVESSVLGVAIDRVKRIFRPYWVKFVLLFVLLLIAAYVVIMTLRSHNKRRYASVKRRRKL